MLLLWANLPVSQILPQATASTPPHITCFSSNRTSRVSSMRFRFTRFTATSCPEQEVDGH